MVGFDPQAPGLDGGQGFAAEGLFQKKRLVVNQPVAELPGAFGVKVLGDRPDSYRAVKAWPYLTCCFS